MKATGIVRRIDDLGRVVIPKEIRRTLRIREADPLEIFTDREGEIILKKYSPIGEMSTFAKQYAESLAQVSGHIALITDRDQFIAVSGGMKNLIGKSISPELEEKIEKRQMVMYAKEERGFIPIVAGEEADYSSHIGNSPIESPLYLYSGNINTIWWKQFFLRSCKIDRGHSHSSAQRITMNHFSLYKKFVSQQMICLFKISFCNFFSYISTTDIPVIFLDFWENTGFISQLLCHLLNQDMIPFSLTSKMKIISCYNAFYI